MNKSEFIEQVKIKGGYDTKVEARRALDAVSEALSDTLVAKDSVNITDIGTFSTKVQKGKSGTLPGSTKTYSTQDKIVPKFSASSKLKEAVSK